MSEVIVVAGGGGFIGGHLVAELLRQGKQVRAVDIKPADEWYQRFDDAENRHAGPVGEGRLPARR